MKMCQSCGMPLKKENDYGSEKDGSLSQKYCHYCYQNGAFTHDCTIEEMITEAKAGMKAKKLPKLIIWLSVKTIPKLERWKNS